MPPANAAIILSAESLVAALGGAVVLGERLTPIGYAGAEVERRRWNCAGSGEKAQGGVGRGR